MGEDAALRHCCGATVLCCYTVVLAVGYNLEFRAAVGDKWLLKCALLVGMLPRHAICAVVTADFANKIELAIMLKVVNAIASTTG